MYFKGIRGRWFKNSFTLVSLVLILIEILVANFIKYYCYKSLEQELTAKSTTLNAYFNDYKVESEKQFIELTNKYIQSFENQGIFTVQVVNKTRKMISASPNTAVNIDVPQLKESKENSSFDSELKYPNGSKKVKALVRNIKDTNGEILGSFCFIASLENTDKAVILGTLISCLIVFLIILFLYISGNKFANSIVRPIREVGKTSRKIALGDFSARLEKSYDDEIGELCDTINYMARKLAESERLKNDFISSISHELRTPLTAIKGWAETIELSDGKDRKLTKKGLDIICKESQRLSGIVEELLDFSKMQSDRVILKLERIDIVAEVSEAVYIFAERAKSENKLLMYSEPGNLPPVFGDKNRLKQVLINVLDNSLKYTPEKGLINVSVLQEDDFISIIVSDNGPGISKKHLPFIKDKFYKVDNVQKGSGIGLAIANTMVLLHSGKLDIKSEENVGTVVTISIPLVKNEAEQEKKVISENQ